MASPSSPSGNKLKADESYEAGGSGDNFPPFANSTPTSSPNSSFIPDACSSPLSPSAFQLMESISSISSLSNNSLFDTSTTFPEEDPHQRASSPIFEELFQNDGLPSSKEIYTRRQDRVTRSPRNLSTILEEMTQENSMLKEQLADKTRQLNISKMRVKVLLDLDESLSLQEDPNNNSTNSGPEAEADENITFTECKGVQVQVDEEEAKEEQGPVVAKASPSRLQIREHTFIFIREITSKIEVYQVRERVVEGILISNQLAFGGAVGWLGAYLVKNFGKSALIAAGGGLLVLTFAKKKGFVEINWNNVLHEVQKVSGESQLVASQSHHQNSSLVEPSVSNLSITENPTQDWTSEKIEGFKNWLSANSIAVVGFATGFLYTAFYL